MKKRTLHKTLAAAFALLLCITSLTSCGSKSDTSAQNDQKNDITANEQSSETADSSKSDKDKVIENIMKDMTLEEKIGQMMMADFRKDDEGYNLDEYLTSGVAAKISDYHLGGIILFSENLSTKSAAKNLISEMNSKNDIPMFFGIDEEGGIVSRLDNSNIPHSKVIRAADMKGNTDIAQKAGKDIGSTLSDLGINVDFAPVADVNTNPNNPVIGSRAYGSNPDTVAEMASAFAKGLNNSGVSPVAKHFPGHGDTASDSHAGAAVSNHDLERLKNIEFSPFRQLIKEDIPFVLVGHIALPKITGDNTPATLSKEIINILRNDMNFDGIVITDAMNMGAITNYYSHKEAAVKAVQAGVDILLMPPDLKAYKNALTSAVKSGSISEERIDQSVKRILSLKYEKGMLR